MSLHLSNPSKTVTTEIKRLPESMLPTVREYAAAVQAKKEADAASRAAENVIKGRKAAISAAMEGATTAICGHAVLTLSQTADAPAALTLKTGEKIQWALVSGLTVGNQYVAAENVYTIFGGRAGSTKLEVKGEEII